MTIEREIPNGVRRELEKPETEDILLVFLTLYVEGTHDIIRVVSDTRNYMKEGYEYLAFDFQINLLSDTDDPPSANLSIPNIDARIGRAILRSVNPIRVDIEVISASEFDLTQNPAVALNDPINKVYVAKRLRLADVTGTLLTISGTLRSWDYTQESWPSLKATQDRFQGLFWT